MYIYIIVVKKSNHYDAISNEAYRTLSDAQRFIEGRSDNPQKYSEFNYKSDELIYEIVEVKVCH